MVVARHDEAQLALMQAFKQRLVQKAYVAITAGSLADDEIQLEAPIGRHPVKRQQMTVAGLNAKSARTIIQVLARVDGHTLVSVRPRSEERRVGKEGSSRGERDEEEKERKQ